ncbi:MAG TPA: GTPase Era [Candidatus Binataceae bacterium]|nr:GTPase Era [Candidatus Binataceae bacterium]
MSTAAEHRAGFVALCGRTNTGKSTLLNRIVGQKVAIVTPRPQTTRGRILGIHTEPNAQIILIDTPGLHEAKRAMNERMVKTARHAIAEADVVLAVVEAGDKLTPEDRAVIAEGLKHRRPAIVAINKVDRISRNRILPMIADIGREFPGIEIVPISALRGENLGELIETIKRMLPPGPTLMPEDGYTDQTERALAAEIVREKIFLKMREEIPFSTAVKIEKFEEDAERNLRKIRAVVVVDHESHKGMIIGAGGATLKGIGTAARHELEQIFGSRVFLEIIVKTERGWTRDPHKLEEFGL